MQDNLNHLDDRILIIGPAWVGDMVMAQPLFMLLKERFPDCKIDVVVPKSTGALLDRMPEINEKITLPLAHGELGLSVRYKLAKVLRQKKYTQAIVLPNSFKSACLPFFANIPKRTGWRGEWRYGLLNDIRVLNKKRYPLMVERFLALGMGPGKSLCKPYPLPKLVVEKEYRNVIVEKLHLQNDDQPILALCPGAAYGPSKQWPVEYFAEVAKEKRKEGWRVWLIGAPSDEQAACLIQEKTNQSCINLIGKTNLAEAIDLLSLVDAVITNDSGTMHIAAALDRPVVAVYGSTSPQFTPPLGEKVKVLSLNLDCSPCFKRTCPLKHWRCMRDLKPELVLTALKELLHS